MLHDRLLFKWCTISKTCRGILREVCLFLQMASCKVIILQCFPTGSWLIQDIFLYTHTHIHTEHIMPSFCMLCLENAQQLQGPMVPSGVCPQSASQHSRAGGNVYAITEMQSSGKHHLALKTVVYHQIGFGI